MSSLIRMLTSHAARYQDETAVVGSQHTLSWGNLDQAVTSLCAQLNECRTIGLLMANSPAWIVSDLAAVSAGKRLVPLPVFFSDEQILHAIQDAEIDAVITDDSSRLDGLLSFTRQRSIRIAGKDCTLLTVPVDGKKLLNFPVSKVTYTSGSTGSPRGVLLSLDAIETVTESLRQAVAASRQDRALVLLPLSTLLENIGTVYIPILVGAQIIVPDAEELGLAGSSKINIQKFAESLCRFRPTSLVVPPQLLKLLVGLARQQALPDSFRYIAVGGAPVGKLMLDNAQSLGLPVYQGYGLSEACSVVTVNTPEHNRPGSVGKPLPHTRIRITTQGGIMVRGQTYGGYLNDTVRKLSDELATGDLGYLDEDGYLYINGRSRNVIISSYGRNISPEWVESELLSHPLIAQAAVLGDGREYLVAVLVPTVSATSQDLHRQLDVALIGINARLPDYARLGDYLIADAPFSIENGQLTNNGRPRRIRIEQHYAELISRLYESKHEQFL